MGAGTISNWMRNLPKLLNEIRRFKNIFSDNSRLNFDHDLSRLNWFNIGGKTKIL